MKKKMGLTTLLQGLMSIFCWIAFAGMSSDHYMIRSMVLSCGGEATGSANYLIESTTGQPSPIMPGTEIPASPNYILCSGFQYTLGEASPVIDAIIFDGCLCELCDTDICVDAHDPHGGTLTYEWAPLGGGEILGSGACVVFDPVYSDPPPCPSQVMVTVISDATGLSTSETIDIYVRLAGDADGSGRVDILDKRVVRDAYGARPGDSNWDPRADTDCSGRVDILDKRKVRDQYGDSGCACP